MSEHFEMFYQFANKDALISFAVKVVQINHWKIIIMNQVEIMIGVVYCALNTGSRY